MGGVAGGVLQPVGEGAAAVGRRAVDAMTGGRPMAEALESAANKQHVNAALGNDKKLWNELTNFGRNPERIDRAGAKAAELNLPTGKREALVAVQAATDDAFERMSSAAAARDAAVIPGVASPWAGMESQAAREAVDAARQQVARIRQVKLGSHQDIANAIEREVAPLEASLAAGQNPSFGQMWHLRAELYKSINWARQSKAPQLNEMKELARGFDEALTRDMQQAATSDPSLQGIATQWAKAKEDVHDLLTLRDGYDAYVTRLDKNRALSLTDYLAWVAGGPVAGVGLAVGNKLLRERGPAVMAKLLSRMAKVDLTMSSASKALLETTPKLARTAGVAEAGSPFANPVKEFAARRAELLANEQDVGLKTERLGHVMTELDGHPDAQTDVADLFERSNQYLLAHLPQPLGRAGTSLTPNLEQARVPRADMMQWLERAWTREDPVGAIASDLAKGRVSRTKLETVQALFPDLYADWGNKMQMMIVQRAQSGKPLPYRRRVFLSMAFGFNGDVSLTPDFLNATQEAHGMLSQMAQGPGGPGGASPAPAQGAQSQLAANLATQTFKFH